MKYPRPANTKHESRKYTQCSTLLQKSIKQKTVTISKMGNIFHQCGGPLTGKLQIPAAPNYCLDVRKILHNLP